MRIQDTPFSTREFSVREDIAFQAAAQACSEGCPHWYQSWAYLMSLRAEVIVHPDEFLELSIKDFQDLVVRCTLAMKDRGEVNEAVGKIEANWQYDFKRQHEPSPADWYVLRQTAEGGGL